MNIERRLIKITKIDYTYKAQVLESGLPIIEGKVSRSLFHASYGIYSSYDYTKEEAQSIYNSYQEIDGDAWHEAYKINHAKYQRTNRLRDRITKYVLDAKSDSSKKAVFLTLTFTDSVLATTNMETRRKYVRRYLKDNCIGYVANIDFGEKNGREHYHALVLVNGKLNYKPWHKIGAINGKIIKYEDIDVERTSKYISKLTNHAIKETTRRAVMIYSKDNKRLA